MATFGIDGLSSGLDTTAIISQLMKLEAVPQTLLKQRQNTSQNIVTAFQAINVKILSLAENATKASKAESWNTASVKSSSAAVTATAAGTSPAGSLTFSVDAVAANQVSLSSLIAEGDQLTDPPVITVKGADGKLTTVTASSGGAADIASAINGSDAGITATVVRVTNDGVPQDRLQFTSKTTGTAGAFEVFAGDTAAVEGNTATRIDAAIAKAATDATITLWKGSDHEQSYTQSSNTFTGLMTGVDVTVATVTDVDKPVTITVAPDPSGVKDLVKNMVAGLSVALSDIDSRTASTTVQNDDGSSRVAGGLLSGDATTRMLRSQLVEAMSYPVDGISPSSVGIVIERDGSITFDEEKFAAAIAKDAEGTAAFVQKLAERVEGAATSIADPRTGVLTQRITSQQSQVDRMADELVAWDGRLERRQAAMERQYAALEVALSGLNAQSSWLASQLSQLNSSTS